jgi:hypothetical protein
MLPAWSLPIQPGSLEYASSHFGPVPIHDGDWKWIGGTALWQRLCTFEFHNRDDGVRDLHACEFGILLKGGTPLETLSSTTIGLYE